uniref:AlNc14C6G831 protein n=1 Tax=Albugo laibachii Nc14 TaxID=890382 RepID=F0W155_9STRA|nr:AlNc14C6G831 [Albugo laibachii Nc14]|eukprot:CCA14780.1 AlNc14C6G831 [Albugo laibachii Nc14]
MLKPRFVFVFLRAESARVLIALLDNHLDEVFEGINSWVGIAHLIASIVC